MKQNAISLCKLKTLEYRINRKIREKCKTVTLDDKFDDKRIKKFTMEVQELADGLVIQKPLEFYINYYSDMFHHIINLQINKAETTKKGNIKENINKIMHNLYVEEAEEEKKYSIPILIVSYYPLKIDLGNIAKEIGYDYIDTNKKLNEIKSSNLYSKFNLNESDLDKYSSFLYVAIGYEAEMEEKELNQINEFSKGHCPHYLENFFFKKTARKEVPFRIKKHFQDQRELVEAITTHKKKYAIQIDSSMIGQIPEILTNKIREIEAANE